MVTEKAADACFVSSANAEASSHQRLRDFEGFVSGDAAGIYSGRGYRTISADNPCINEIELFKTDCLIYAPQRTTGYASIVTGPAPAMQASGVTVCYMKSSEAELRTPRDTKAIKAGDLYIHSTHDGEITFGAGEMERMMFPRSFFAGILGECDPVSILRAGDPVGDVLKSTMSALTAEFRTAEQEQMSILARIARSMVHDILANATVAPVKSRYEIIRERTRIFIEENLEESEIEVETIARHVNASRSTLYRAFEGLGGVREFVVGARLDAARRMLMNRPPQRGDILNVSYDCGFSSPNHFRRAFRHRFGVAPSEFVKLNTVKK